MNDLGLLVWLAGGDEDGARRLAKSGLRSLTDIALADPVELRIRAGLSEAGARWLSHISARLAMGLEGLTAAPADEADLRALALEDLAMTVPGLESASAASGERRANTWDPVPLNGPAPHPAEPHGVEAKETRKGIGER